MPIIPGSNDFLTFGSGSGANVLAQASYAALTARLSGFQSGIAASQQLNKVWRQSSIISSMIAQFIADQTGQNSVDDGTIATLEANFLAAIQQVTFITLSAPLNLFVSPPTAATNPGNDALNSGLAANSPFATLQHAILIAQTRYNTNGNPITINLGPGTYTAGGSATGGLIGGGQLIIQGSISNPASVSINLAVGGSCISSSLGANVKVAGISMTASQGVAQQVFTAGGVGLNAQAGGQIVIGGPVILNNCITGQIVAISGGIITTSAAGISITLAGGSRIALWATISSQITIFNGAFTLSGTPNYSLAFADADVSALIQTGGSTFTGGATGQRYNAGRGGAIDTGTGGVTTTLPGTVAGTSATGFYN